MKTKQRISIIDSENDKSQGIELEITRKQQRAQKKRNCVITAKWSKTVIKKGQEIRE